MAKSPTSLPVISHHVPIGLNLWILCVQYYIIQAIVALTWKTPYSLKQNTISDLGNTSCGPYGSRFVCSPLHSLMNISFAILGLLMAFGAMLLYRESVRKTSVQRIGYGFIVIAGIGTILVGLFPENTVSQLHIVGAALPFTFGNIALLFFGFMADVPKPFRLYAFISGVVSLLALVAFMTNQYLGIGIGGMERLVAYPQSIWMIVFGSYVVISKYKLSPK